MPLSVAAERALFDALLTPGVAHEIVVAINTVASGSGITDVSVANSHGVSAVSNHDVAIPTLTFTLGAITPTTIVASGAISGSNLSGTNTGDQTISLTGDMTGTGTGSFATTIKTDIALPGNPTTTTQSPGNNTTRVATTAFVTAAVAAGVGSSGLIPTAVKTTNYSAAAGDFVPVNATGGDVTVTLPAAPANGTMVAVRCVNLTGGSAIVACGGSDVFDRAAGATSLTLDFSDQTVWVQYRTTGAIWYFLADSTSVVQLFAAIDATYVPLTKTTGWTLKQSVSTITVVTAVSNVFTCNLSLSNWFQCTLGATNTLDLSNPTTGQQFTLRLVQDGTGSRTVTWFTGITWIGTGTPPTLSTAANSVDVFTFKCTGSGAYDGFSTVSSGGSGTVTSVSVATANGYSGTVATATTTPAITIIPPTTGITITQHIAAIGVGSIVSTTATLDLATHDFYTLTLANAATTTIALSNPTVGQTFRIRLLQDGTGTCLVNWFTTIKWAGGSPPTLTTTAGKADTFVFTCMSSGQYDGFIAGQNI